MTAAKFDPSVIASQRTRAKSRGLMTGSAKSGSRGTDDPWIASAYGLAMTVSQAGSRPFALITALAAGVVRNAISALPSAARLAFAGMPATNGVII